MAGHLVVLSGGLDSTVCMALAGREAGRPPLALTFDYGQRHRTELDRAAGVAGHYRSEHLVVVARHLRLGRLGAHRPLHRRAQRRRGRTTGSR